VRPRNRFASLRAQGGFGRRQICPKPHVGFSPGSTGVNHVHANWEEEFLQRVVLLVICVSDLYKEWLFMNRREALMAAVGSIAAVVAIPSVASAETAETEDDNPELAPIRALLDAYDSGVLVVLGSPPCRRPKLGFGSIGGPSPRRMDQPMGWWSRQVDQPMGWSASRSMDQSVVMGTPNLSVSEENSISLKFLPQLW
jgi:hypothetical protein